MDKQLDLFPAVKEENPTELRVGAVMRPCPYCGRSNLVIREKEYEGNLFYSITHDDHNLGWKKRKCGILISHSEKDKLIEWYNSMEWTEQHGV